MKFVKCLELKVCRKIYLNVMCDANQKRLRTTAIESLQTVAIRAKLLFYLFMHKFSVSLRLS